MASWLKVDQLANKVKAQLGGPSGHTAMAGGSSSGSGSVAGSFSGGGGLGGNGGDALVGTTLNVGKYTVLVERPLNEGAFAQVYIARGTSDGRAYALKRINLPNPDMLQQVRREIRFMVRSRSAGQARWGTAARRVVHLLRFPRCCDAARRARWAITQTWSSTTTPA